MAPRPTKDDMEVLHAIPLFSSASQKELKQILEECRVRKVRDGERLTEEGLNGREFFVVLSGTARCEVADREIRTFGRGSFFGELSLLTGGPRSATIIAETPMEVLVLDRRDFTDMLRTSPGITIKVLKSVAERLQHADRQVTN